MNPLKYRGVFDYPYNQSTNLIDAKRNKDGEPNPPSSSEHVLKFLGWTGRGHAKYTGKVSTQSVLDQKAAWIALWLRKGQYAAGQ